MARETINNRDNWLFDNYNQESIIRDKTRLANMHLEYMLDKAIRICEWENLPDTIPMLDLERIIICCGYATVINTPQPQNGDAGLYAYRSGLGGRYNAYYRPTLSVVANPYTGLNGSYKIDDECVVINNDHLRIGLLPLFEKYASLIAETEVSLRFALVNSRSDFLIQANTTSEQESAQEVLRKIDAGEEIGVILTSPFAKEVISGMTNIALSNSTSGKINELIELENYLKSQWYIELGLNSNYNMKREAINSAEVHADDYTLLPLIDEMLLERKKACEKINAMYGTNISVHLSKLWSKVYNEVMTDKVEQPEQETEPVKEEVENENS